MEGYLNLGHMRRQSAKLLWMLALCLSVAASTLAQEVKVSFKPVWVGHLDINRIYPVNVTLQNTGGDTVAKVTATISSLPATTLVELPGNSVKTVTLYPHSGGQMDWAMMPKQEIIVESRYGKVYVPLNATGFGFPMGNEVPNYSFGYIGNNVGDETFLKVRAVNDGPWNKEVKMESVGVNPDEAPDRTIGYLNLDAIILGEGAERLSDESVRAIQDAVLLGKTLIVFGGAPKPYLNDPRWAGFWPITINNKTRLATFPSLASYAKVPPPVTIGDVEPIASALALYDNGNLLRATVKLGLGQVVYFNFDIFAGSLRTWGGRKGMLYGAIKQSLSDRIRNEGVKKMFALNDIVSPNQNEEINYSYNPYGGTDSISVLGNYIDIKLPSPGVVFWILLAYVLLVVPANFWILNKMRRGQLVWITAPMIAIVFAAIFFQFSSGLSKMKSGYVTIGTLFTTEGVDRYVFCGNQELFLSKAGRYDLGLHNVDYFAQTAGSDTTKASAIDVGEVLVPEYRVRNLSFSGFEFNQQVDVPHFISQDLTYRTKGDKVVIEGIITNHSDQNLQTIMLFWGNQTVRLGPVPANGRKKVHTVLANQIGSACYLTFGVNMPLGAQIGKDYTEDTLIACHSVLLEEAR